MKKSRALSLAKRVIAKLDTWRQDGIPKCYRASKGDKFSLEYSEDDRGEKIPSFLYDFYPDLPWDSSIIHSLEWLTTENESLKILEQFNNKFEFDMLAELKKALEIHLSE